MIETVCPDYLGESASFYETAPVIAAQGYFHGYYSYEITRDLARGVPQTRACFAENGLIPCGFRLPVDISAPCAVFEAGMQSLEQVVQAAAQTGYRSALTWIMPGSEEFEVMIYHAVLVYRLRRFAALLANYQMDLAVEMVAPYTLQAAYRYPAPCRMEHLLRLLHEVDRNNVGIVLDAFHFYCAGHRDAAYGRLPGTCRIMMAHLSDGVPNRIPQQQCDLERRLPGTTGVVPCGPFFDCLKASGYTGGVVPEPLGHALDGMSFEEKLRCAAKSMQRVWPKSEDNR